MKRCYFIHTLAILLCVLLATSGGYAESKAATKVGEGGKDAPWVPMIEVGEGGKDAPWVPTPQKFVELMLDMAKIAPSDYVIDLGSGDGRVVITAAKRGATALGIEYHPDLVEMAKRLAAREGVSERATFQQGDMFKSDFSKATVLTLYLLRANNLKLRPQILSMKPGARIVSHDFGMGDWKPDQTRKYRLGWRTFYLWIVPAKVHGVWKLLDGEINFIQEFQYVSGTLSMGEKETKLTGKLIGNTISFTADGTDYTGTVSDNMIVGTHTRGGSWKAVR